MHATHYDTRRHDYSAQDRLRLARRATIKTYAWMAQVVLLAAIVLALLPA